MPNDCISYQKSDYFSSLMVDYLNQKTELEILYNHFPTLENFKLQLEEKKANFPFQNRQILHNVLKKQYEKLSISELTAQHINAILTDNTFTITTGHQLNLFTGPLYFLYKIISTINLSQALKTKYPSQNFVPIYWMATEDHDFEEINYFKFHGKKIQWDTEHFGAVGALSTEGLEVVLDFFKNELGSGNHAKQLISWFENAYLKRQNLTDATRYLANELFGSFGLVILDANDLQLKKRFSLYIKDEIFQQTSFLKVSEQLSYLKNYSVQVNPREINLFYMDQGLRERIVFEDRVFKVLNTELVWDENQMHKMIDEYPEKFSPNVILRPLYQEVILPNLCYIGGGGEIAYWLELKGIFDHYQITFPILLLRNSVLLTTEKQAQKANKLGLSWADLFLKSDILKVQKTHELSKIKIDFSAQKLYLKQQFEQMLNLSSKTHTSFLGAVKSQERKQIKGLEHLEKRLLKAEMKIHQDTIDRIIHLKNELFPQDALQERVLNFSEFYENYGPQMIQNLMINLNPLDQTFHVEILKY